YKWRCSIRIPKKICDLPHSVDISYVVCGKRRSDSGSNQCVSGAPHERRRLRIVRKSETPKKQFGFTRRMMLMGATVSSIINTVEGSADTDALFSALYSELHRLAKRELARRVAPGTLSVTTLLHEAYLNIVERDGASFPDH